MATPNTSPVAPPPASACDRCDFFAHNLFLVCAVHPTGPRVKPCPDFEPATAPPPLLPGSGCKSELSPTAQGPTP